MLYLHFTVEDLIRTRFSPAPSPLIELGLAVAVLQRDDALFGPWRRRTAPRLPRETMPLLQLIPPSANGPLFLDPPADTFEEGLDQVLSTPDARVRGELVRVVPAARPLTPFVRALYDHDGDAWKDLVRALAAAHEALIARPWDRLRASSRADVAWRGQIIAEEGLGSTLVGLFPGAIWRDATLGIPAERDRHIELGGRGLTLQPSAYWTGPPLTCPHSDGSRLLVYPAATALPLIDAAAHGESIGELLGQTRAAVLTLTALPRTTTQVARILGISLGSASQHTKVLRAAGLIATRRDGKAVQHTATPLGHRLIRGG